MVYSQAQLKSSGDKASLFFKPFLIKKTPSDKCLPTQTQLYVSFTCSPAFFSTQNARTHTKCYATASPH